MDTSFQCRFCEAELEAESHVLGQTANCPQCGHLLLVPLPHLAPGTVLGGFQIIRRLAQGGMGEVFLARQMSMDRDVALKILSPILLDFGLAKPLASGATSDGSGGIAGTPLYISPEALQKDSKRDFRSDMYSLGATMYCVATGVPPFEGKSAVEILQKHLNAPVPDPRERRKNLSAGFARLVMAMMAKRPSDRYRTWQELIDDFYRVSLGEEPEGPGARRTVRGAGQHQVVLARRVRWYRVALAVLIAALILLIGAAGVVISMLL